MRYLNKLTTAILATAVLISLGPVAGADTGLRNLLNLTGARQSATGETAALFDHDPFNLEYNPALMVGQAKGKLGFSHNSFIQDRNTNSLAAIFPAQGLDFGIHTRLASVGEIEVRQGPTSEPDYITSADEFAIKAFSAFKVAPGLQLGVSAGWLMQKIDIERASLLAFGFGAVYYTRYNLALHGSASNLGGKVKFVSQEDDPPAIYRAGLGYYKYDLSLSADYVNIKSGEGHIHFGGEYLLKEQLFLRAGYQTGYDNRDFSAGAGFVYKEFRVDYAFVPYQSDLGNSHRFTLTYSVK
jgi:hypothetical protein